MSVLRLLEPLPLSSPFRAASDPAVNAVAAVCLPAARTWDERIEGGFLKVGLYAGAK